ncbi:QRFP-like peptide receptor [Physella acuta]|uniref:QRFP-like peptide receptor n=1 Tax=Physella acuta TaxID=109671 RepID=UPI0027DDC7B5|nr:QRFP-like peptide receptor [Physella acuta]
MEIVLVPTYPAEGDNFSQVESSEAAYNASPGSRPGNGTDINPPPYIYVYVAFFSALILTVGVLGNLLVIQVVIRIRSMRKRMNYFLVCLSTADLLVLLIAVPSGLQELFGKGTWYFGDPMCKGVMFLENAAHDSSILTLLAIGFERYYAICHPLKETVGSRLTSATIVIPAVWIVSGLIALPYAFISHTKEISYYDGSVVEICEIDWAANSQLIYVIFLFVVCFVLPLALLTGMYIAIIITIHASTATASHLGGGGTGSGTQLCSQRDNERNARTLKGRRQVIKMMIAVMLMYFFCLLPFRCFQFWTLFASEEELVSLGFHSYLNIVNICRLLIFINSACNPVIYGLVSSTFRSAFRHSLCSFRSSRRDVYKYSTKYNGNLSSRHAGQQTQYSTCTDNNYTSSVSKSNSDSTERDKLRVSKKFGKDLNHSPVMFLDSAKSSPGSQHKLKLRDKEGEINNVEYIAMECRKNGSAHSYL